MNNLYEVLEICLQDIEQGADLETVLFRYPDLADELRPILEGALHARNMVIVAPSTEVVRRNRARVLQHAAHMRESKAKQSSQRIWFVSLRRLAVTLAVVTALFVSGTGLVRAASTTLPGDNLYPVKRTWEDVLVMFTFNLQQREELEIEHENERLHELRDLFATGRAVEVDFAGRVTSQNQNEWIVNGVRVVLSPQTEVRDGPIGVGSAVRIRGLTQENGVVLAERIRLLSSEDTLPEIEYETESEGENHQGPNQQNEDNSGKGSGSESPEVEETKAPESDSEPKDESFDGTVTSIDNNVVIVDGIEMNVSTAEVKGTPSVGASVKVEGYYDANGVFIVTKIEYESDGSGSGDDSGSSSDSISNDDSSNDSSGGNDNGSHDSGGDDSGGGGGDNSGSGGGGGGDD